MFKRRLGFNLNCSSWTISRKVNCIRFSLDTAFLIIKFDVKIGILGSGTGTGDSRRVVVSKIELHSPDLKSPLSLDLTQAAEELKKQSFKIKEGSEYHLVFFFNVNNEIVSGLRFNQGKVKTYFI